MPIAIKTRGIQNGLAVFLSMGLLLILAPAVSAHDFWIERSGGDLVLIFGHGEQREEFDISRVKAARSFSSGGGENELRGEKRGKGLVLRPAEPPSWVFVEIDNGYWSKTIYGWKNLPKRKASRVVEANRSVCYAKAILTWNEALRQPASRALLDIVPRENPFSLKAGDSLPVKVYFRGKPLAGAEIEGRDHDKVAISDKDGNAKLRLSGGRQLLSVDYKEAVRDDPDADFISYAATLTFEVVK
jgi:nickel transport protein